MMRGLYAGCAAALLAVSYAQLDSGSYTTINSTVNALSTTGTYAALTGQVTVSQTSGLVNGQTTASNTANSTASATSVGTTSTITLLRGGGLGAETLSVINGTTTIYPSSTTSSGSATTTSTSATATNTQACNSYPEYCSRKYSNITEVAAHNAAFAVKGNAASNQDYGVVQQLNDGIRVLTGETHYVNDTFYNCHTSCDLLDVGPYSSELALVATWVEDHPYDVVTLLIVNSDFRPVEEYATVFEASGLSPYLYTPPYIPMRLDDWPTLSQMILTQKRVVVFMDYDANQTSVPYILDEFTHMWETPFSPQDVNFPCTIQRPPTLTNTTEAKEDFMYLANHNLNQAITFAGTTLLIPNTAAINVTNAAGNETGMLGLMASTCDNEWGRPPKMLLVDFYNDGSGSVFEVAARMNNVTYNNDPCCGYATTSAAVEVGLPLGLAIVAVAVAIGMMFA